MKRSEISRANDRAAPPLFRHVGLCLLAALALTLHLPQRAPGAPPPSGAYVVEEEWKLVLVDPGSHNNSPQFSTYFKVSETLGFLTTFNFREYPEYQPGGIQLQYLQNDECVQYIDVLLGSLNVAGDTITWTHVYKLAGGNAENKIVGINSQAWGQNINSSGLPLPNTGISNFNQYDPSVSTAQSGIGFGANRVSWFGITEVRVYDDKGKKLLVDSTLRPAHP